MKYLLFALFLFVSLAASANETLTIDQSHSAVIFNWSHRGFSNPVARFDRLAGKIVLNTADISKSSVTVSIPLESLHTAIEFLDRRLKGDEFFAAATYPEITFKSTAIAKGPMDTLSITGDLTMHGITKSVVLNARINKIQPRTPSEPARAGFDADTMLRRTDFGVDKYVPAVADDVYVHITLEAFQET
jgi:polyisoprenoid-binding protein YceI